MREFTLKDIEEVAALLEKEAVKPPTPPDLMLCSEVIEVLHEEGKLEFILKEYNVIVGCRAYDKLIELGYLKLKSNES